MRPVSRRNVNKRSAARSFNRASRHTKAANVAGAPMRGGWRL